MRSRPTVRLLSLAFFLLPTLAFGQPPQAPPLPVPRLLTAMPPGGKAGTTVELTLSGQDIEGAEALFFSQPGIKADVIEPGTATVSDPKRPVPVVARFKVTIPADTPPGIHDVRVVNRFGISNPRAFVVGDLDEVLDKEPNNDVSEAQRVELNTTASGAISGPTDVDYYVFAGKKGQRVVVSCLASSIDSRLSAAVQLYSSGGSPLAFNRNYHLNDALLDHTLPDDGDYYVRLFAFTYTQGGPEHFYRLSISTAPWIDAVFPPVVEPGQPTQATVYGRNLPGGKPDPSAMIDGRVLEKATVAVNVPNEPAALQRLAYNGHVPPLSSGLDGFGYHLRGEAGRSNPFLLTCAQAPVVLDTGDNNTPDTAQPISLPCEIAGRIEAKRDRDWYVFAAKKGDVYSIEVYGDRLGTPTDLYFVLRNADTGQALGEFDDNPEVLSTTQFYTRSEDPARQRFVAPADGRYQLMVSSREAFVQAGPRHLYRVRITPEQPDFRLVVMPPSTNNPDGCVVRQGGKQYYTVFLWRRDGFSGEVALSAEGLPPGVTCPPQMVGTGMRQGTLVVSAAADAMPWTGAIQVKGSAPIGGQTVEREARAAAITWPVQQQNAVTLTRLDRDVVLAVRERAPFDLTASIDKTTLLHNERATVTLKLARLWPDFKGPVQVTALNLPPTVTVQPFTVGDKGEATATLGISTTVPPGTYTVLFRGQAQAPFVKDPGSKQKPVNATLVQAATPVTFTVFPRQLATVSVTPAAPTVKTGAETEVMVRVNRQANYGGEFKVQLVTSAETKGLSAEPVTIPAGKDEAKLVIKAEADAAPGARKGLVQATALIDGKTSITQDAKINVMVVK